MSTPTCISSKLWEPAWGATARLQGRPETEQERRPFKLNAMAARTASYFLNYARLLIYWFGHSFSLGWGFLRCSCLTSTKRLLSFVRRASVDTTWFLGFRLIMLGTTSKLALMTLLWVELVVDRAWDLACMLLLSDWGSYVVLTMMDSGSIATRCNPCSLRTRDIAT